MSNVGFLLGLCYSSSWLIGIACVLHLMYKYTRKFVRVTVNCWFCNVNSKVPWIKKNDWHCINCDQFNGFDKDGNYNKPITEQFTENLSTKYSRPYPFPKNYTSKSNGLCRICNANQELKIRQLAIYEPFREENYDEEIEIFKERLEKSYKLCCICEETVKKTLKLKSTQFSEDISNVAHKNKALTKQNQISKKKKVYVYVLFFTIVILMASFWKYGPLKTDLFENELFKNFSNVDFTSLKENYGIFIDIVFFFCIAVILKIRNIYYRIFTLLLLFGIIIYGIQDYLPPILKVSIIVAFILYIIGITWRNKKTSMKCKKLSDNFRNQLTDINEDDTTPIYDNVFANNPLCGKFSNLSLGRSSTVASPKIVPYLFRSTKSIIQPPRLKLDESDRCETPRSSQTTSSGYDSVANYLKRSPDSISEFDSVSQIGDENRYSPFDLKWQCDKKSGSFVTASNKRAYTFGSDSGLVSPYLFSRNQCFSLSDQYYGVSPAFTPNQSSEIQRNYLFPSLSIILCSFVFFILGFSLQLFINRVLS